MPTYPQKNRPHIVLHIAQIAIRRAGRRGERAGIQEHQLDAGILRDALREGGVDGAAYKNSLEGVGADAVFEVTQCLVISPTFDKQISRPAAPLPFRSSSAQGQGESLFYNIP